MGGNWGNCYEKFEIYLLPVPYCKISNINGWFAEILKMIGEKIQKKHPLSHPINYMPNLVLKFVNLLVPIPPLHNISYSKIKDEGNFQSILKLK